MSEDEEDNGDHTYGDMVKIVAADAYDGDCLGTSMAVNGDTAVVGAPTADSPAADAGAAYVFYRNNGGTNKWGQAVKLTASDAEAGDYFGIAVAVSGDYILVGASSEDGAGTDRGAAYIFYRNQGGTDAWGQVAKLVPSAGENSAAFGAALAIYGNTAIIAADSEDGAGTNRGAAYVFYKDQGGTDAWGQVVRLSAPTPQDADRFGYSVGIDGDLAIVGAPGRMASGENAGAAELYSRNQGGTDAWGPVKTIVPDDHSSNCWFGYSVSISGNTAAVGAPGNPAGGTNRGAAYVFLQGEGGADNWGQVKKLMASDATDSDQLGYCISVDASAGIVAAGAPYADGAGIQLGHAYAFSKDQGGTNNWGQLQILETIDADNFDYLGSSVAVNGNFILTGAPGEDQGGLMSGAAYMFRKQ